MSAPGTLLETAVQRTVLEPHASSYGGTVRLEWKAEGALQTHVVRERAVIGSAPAADVVVEADRAVSRVHVEVDPRLDGVWVRDLGSKNGTYVQGLRVTEARVPHLGKVTVGDTEITLVYGNGGAVELWAGKSFGPLIGGSRPMRELYARLAKVAASDAPVLVTGETGTGKELVARALHDASARAGGPFVVVDCSALPSTLLDAELFGHARGAFTGATSARAGAIEAADGGTVFLDEIGELPPSMQPKLLRVLEARTVRRLGETEHRPVDVRFVAATHRDLLAMVGAGELREDLYFRLAVLPLRLPPLRDRPDDLPALVARFAGRPAPESLIAELTTRSWRGNVRELRNFVDRWTALGAEEALASLDAASTTPALPLVDKDEAQTPPFELPYRQFRDAWLERGDRAYLAELMARHGNDVAAAAREAQIDRTYLYRLLRRSQR